MAKLNVVRVEIFNLFDMFDYDIRLNDELTIITSPNGYGKSTILRMINNFTSRNYYSFLFETFDKVVFHIARSDFENKDCKDSNNKRKKIINELISSNSFSFSFDDDEIKRLFDVFPDSDCSDKHSIERENPIVHKIEIVKNNRVVTISDLSAEDSPTAIIEQPSDIDFNFISSAIESKAPLTRVSYDAWVDDYSGELFEFKKVVDKYSGYLSDEVKDRLFKNTEWLDEIVSGVNSYFIPTDRIKANQARHRRNIHKEKSSSMIKNLASIISDKIHDGISNQFDVGRQKETSFPERLMKAMKSSDKSIGKDDISILIRDIQDYESTFSRLGLISENTNRTTNELNEFIEYDSSNTGNIVLKIYLEDIRSKFKALDGLALQLRLFTDTVNRLLSFKEIRIVPKKGFVVQALHGKKFIDLGELSSGEQHIIVMIGKLIFESKKGDLVLIDEPEISLHPEWQENYISSLNKIRKEREFKIVMATHSTMIIGDRWDAVIELKELTSNGGGHE